MTVSFSNYTVYFLVCVCTSEEVLMWVSVSMHLPWHVQIGQKMTLALVFNFLLFEVGSTPPQMVLPLYNRLAGILTSGYLFVCTSHHATGDHRLVCYSQLLHVF